MHPAIGWKSMTTFPTKSEVRSRVLAQRRARSVAARIVAHAQLAGHLAPLLTAMARERPVRTRASTPFTVCSYLPLPSEPLPPALTAELVAAGVRVLVPVVTHAGPLDWCLVDARNLPSGDEHAGAGYARGSYGILQPTGPRLGPLAIRTADVVLVPALAVDITGTRLGRGAGHYDRSLALLDTTQGAHSDTDTGDRAAAPHSVISGISSPAPGPAPRLIAVLFDEEIVDRLPREPHDIPVTDVVTPDFGLGRIAPAVRRVAQRGPRGASST